MKNLNDDSLVRSLATIYYSHKLVVLLIFLIVFTSFVCYAWFEPETYQAEGAFLVKAKNTEIILDNSIKDKTKSSTIKGTDLFSESQILNSGHVVNLAANKLINEQLITLDETILENDKVENLSNLIKDRYSVSIDNKAKLIQPSIEWSNPDQARIILNTLMDSYIQYRSEIFNSAQSKDISTGQVTEYLDQWKKKKQETLDLIKEHNVPDTELELANNLELKKEYQIQLSILEKDRVSLNEDIKILTSMLNDKQMHLFSFLSSGVLSSLVDSLQATQKQKLEADKLFLPSRVEVRELDQQFKNNYGKIRSEVESHLRKQKSVLIAKEQTKSNLNNKLRKLERRNIKLKEIAIQMDQLKMESSFLASSFEAFYKKHNVSHTGGVLDANIILLSPAKTQLALSQAARIKIISLGFILAIILGLFVAFILDSMDNTIRTRRDLQQYAKFPILFSLEEVKAGKS